MSRKYMKKRNNKQSPTKSIRLETDLWKRITEKANKEKRNKNIVLNRLVNKALQLEDAEIGNS